MALAAACWAPARAPNPHKGCALGRIPRQRPRQQQQRRLAPGAAATAPPTPAPSGHREARGGTRGSLRARDAAGRAPRSCGLAAPAPAASRRLRVGNQVGAACCFSGLSGQCGVWDRSTSLGFLPFFPLNNFRLLHEVLFTTVPAGDSSSPLVCDFSGQLWAGRDCVPHPHPVPPPRPLPLSNWRLGSLLSLYPSVSRAGPGQ